MYAFEDLDSVHNALHLLAKREPPVVKVLPRQPGTKESRYVHLLSPVEDALTESASRHDLPVPPRMDKVAALEAEITELREEVAALKEQFAQFRKQLE
jgi:uncharacterized protein YceH (UPF0502 family)